MTKPLTCSFCAKHQSQVTKLVAGPGVYICNECVDLCQEIISEELGQTDRVPGPGTSSDAALWKYLEELRDIPHLERTKERELLEAARARDRDALRRVIRSHLEVTAVLALKLAPDGMPPLDAVQEANLVLMKLIDDRKVAEPLIELAGRIRQRFDELSGGG